MIISIQFLRFIAAALVVLNHSMGEFQTLTPFGSFGVDIFFIISGFIISQITQSGPSLFFVKRFIRIAPQYWLFTFALAFIAYIAPHLLRSAKFDVAHIISSLAFVPYWTEGTAFSPILKLGWTLNYEMFFYLLFFLAMKLNFRYREAVCSVLLLAVVCTLNLVSLDKHSALAFYSSSIPFEFIFGMALSLLYRHYRTLFRNPSFVVGFVSLSFIFLYFFVTTEPTYREMLPRFVMWGIPAFYCVFLFLWFEPVFLSLSGFGQLVILWAGDVSYPLYLLHIYFIALISRILGFLHMDLAPLFLVSLCLSCMVATVVMKLFDLPVRRRLLALVSHTATSARAGVLAVPKPKPLRRS